jgi:cell division protein FtsQ
MSDPGGRYSGGEASGYSSVGDSTVSAGHAVLSDRTRSAGSAPRDETARPRPRIRSRARWRAALFALALTAIVAGAAWALLGSRLLAVRSVVVTGTRLVPQSEVLAVAGIEPGTPLIRVNTAKVAARVETIPQVQSARVTRSWPDRVVIAVRERTPVLAVPAPGGGFDLVDPDGVIVRWAARRPSGLPPYLTTAVVSSLRGDPDVWAAAAVLGDLPDRLRASVISVTVPSTDQVTLRLTHGVTVLWGGTGNAREKAAELGALMPTHASYYDVSAPGTAVTN